MRKLPVIFDGDMGGDDMWAIALLLANAGNFHIQGITSVFGNTSRDIATRNALNFLNALGNGHIPVVAGATRPMDGSLPFGDDAYGENGVGGVTFPDSPYPSHNYDVTNWLKGTIESNQAKMTIFVTGPATNMGTLMKAHPHLAGKIDRFIIMAGAQTPPGKDGKLVPSDFGIFRHGNITPRAEFNAFQDPHALNVLVNSGVPCHFLTMDSNHHLVLTQERIEQFRAMKLRHGEAMLNMMNAVADLDRTKFGVDGAFIHDPNVIIYALQPELYRTVKATNLHFTEEAPGDLSTTHRGETLLMPEMPGQIPSNLNVTWASAIKSSDAVFESMMRQFARVLPPAPASNQTFTPPALR